MFRNNDNNENGTLVLRIKNGRKQEISDSLPNLAYYFSSKALSCELKLCVECNIVVVVVVQN